MIPFLEPVRASPGFTLIYGPAASGKTTLLMQLASLWLKQKKKCFILDTEGGFSIERLQQIMGEQNNWLDSLFVLKIKDFTEQNKKVSMLIDMAQTCSFIGIDTLGVHYRKAVREDARDASEKLAMQCRILQQLSRNKPVVATNQVYQDFNTTDVNPVGGKNIKGFFDNVITLQNDPRILHMKKPEHPPLPFLINDLGLSF